jgi:hypothetical protein
MEQSRENGLKRWTLTSPLTVMVNALLLLSMKRLDWQVSRAGIGDRRKRGVVLGVKLEV